MALLQKGPAPLSTPISEVDQKTGKFTGYLPVPWADYFNSLDAQIANTSALADRASIAAGSTSVGVTPITNAILGAGLYRVSYYLVETQADNVGSSVTVSISWTDGGTSRTLAGPALTANSIGAAQSLSYLLRVDRATPVSYAITYSSTGGVPRMIYSFEIALELVVAL